MKPAIATLIIGLQAIIVVGLLALSAALAFTRYFDATRNNHANTSNNN